MVMTRRSLLALIPAALVAPKIPAAFADGGLVPAGAPFIVGEAVSDLSPFSDWKTCSLAASGEMTIKPLSIVEVARIFNVPPELITSIDEEVRDLGVHFAVKGAYPECLSKLPNAPANSAALAER